MFHDVARESYQLYFNLCNMQPAKAVGYLKLEGMEIAHGK